MRLTRNSLPITKAKYGGYPSFYAAQAYDTILAIDHAIAKSGSKETAKMRAVLAAGNIPTTRGVLKMNTNHFPIQNVYLREVVKDADGVVTTKIVNTVFKDHGDAYAVELQILISPISSQWPILPLAGWKLPATKRK
jgi:branched-chain amino acid transport system substrate-binding protein